MDSVAWLRHHANMTEPAILETMIIILHVERGSVPLMFDSLLRCIIPENIVICLTVLGMHKDR